MSVKNRTGDPCFRRPFRENELERNLRGTKGGSRGIRQMTATETSTGLLKYLWNELNECVHECGGKDWIFPGHWAQPTDCLLKTHSQGSFSLPGTFWLLPLSLPSGHPFPREPGWDYCLYVKTRETEAERTRTTEALCVSVHVYSGGRTYPDRGLPEQWGVLGVF